MIREMNIGNLVDICNVSKKYEHKQMEAVCSSVIAEPYLSLKFYEMYLSGKPFDKNLIKQSTDFLHNEIKKGRIETYIGTGFAILSEDMLNVAIWDNEHPIVLKNQIYGYKKDFERAELLDMGDVGSFCIWELGIVNHERNAWKKFLESDKTEEEKLKYLFRVYDGLL